MPQPRCVQCDTTDTLLWRTAENGQICIECHFANTTTENSEIKSEGSGSNDDEEQDDDDDSRIEEDITPADVASRDVRESTRSLRYKAKTLPSVPPEPLERSRRSALKREPLRAYLSTPTVVTSDCVFYKGTYMQVGDIVFLVHIDGSIYYAQIRRFLTDEKGEKSAVVTWLLPTKASPPPNEWFDPATYILGPEEDLPRKLSCINFVMHAPSDYYKASNSPYPLTDSELNNYSGYIWTSLEAMERSKY